MDLAELKEEQRRLEKALSLINKEIYDIELAKAISESPFKVGDKVFMYGKAYEITGTKLKYSGARHYGKKILKSGELGVRVFELYGSLSK